MTRLAIVGAGDLGQLIAHHAIEDGRFELAGFFDDYQQVGATVGLGDVLGGTGSIASSYAAGRFDELLVAVGYKHFAFREAVFEQHRSTIPMARLIHASCYVDASARIEEGSVLLPGCVVDRNAVIGPNALLNVGCTVAHDTTVGAHSFLAPRVTLAGFVSVGSKAFLGIGTTVVDNIRLCDGCQTGGGAVVIDDVVEPGLYVGVPARRVH